MLSDIVTFLLVIGGLIIGHEVGHFVAARMFGVAVEEFGLGFPPRIISLFEAGGTKFSLNWIPLGGFVRIAGENDPDVEAGLANSSKAVRSIVLLAGPAANVILAFIAFTFAFRFAAPDLSKVLITGVSNNTPAEQAGILPGDVVLKIDDVEINGFDSMLKAVGERVGNEIGVTIDRGGELQETTLIPRTTFPDDQGPMGVSIGNPTKEIPWSEAITIGVDSTIFQFREIILLPAKLLQGEIEPEAARISGLKGMYDMLAWAGDIDRSSQRPFVTLNLIGVISAGLAIANLLPIPALDGGRLIFVLIEFLIGKRISPRYEGLAHTIGFAVLLVILIYVNFLDFVKPISLP
jgi:regulator of sigma E protease